MGTPFVVAEPTLGPVEATKAAARVILHTTHVAVHEWSSTAVSRARA